MSPPALHDWDIELSEAAALQRELASHVCLQPPSGPIRRIAGVDVSYARHDTRLVAGVVVLDAETLQPLESQSLCLHTEVPYVPGFLSFREVPPLLAVLEKLSTPADLIVCDGHGIAHPRRFGVATHLGLWLDVPTLGCAKTPLLPCSEPAELRGARCPIEHKGETLGYALRTRSHVKPVYVSPGHRMSLQAACDWVLHLAPKWRLPETTRRADHLVGECMRQWRG